MDTQSYQATESPSEPARLRRRLFFPYVLSGLVVLIVAVVALGVLKGTWRLDNLWRLGSTGSSGTTTVQLSMGGFRPKVLEVKSGTEVRLELVNAEEGYEHQLAIDELDVSYVVQPKSEQVVSFTPTEPGTYTFYCDVCCGGQANPTMRGTLRVDA